MDDDRRVFDALLRRAQASSRKWESLNDHDKRVFNCELRESIAGALNDAYADQRAGHQNYRLSAEDVLYARRVAVWMRYGLADWTWKQEPENAAALDLRNRVAKLTGPSAVLSEEAQRRLSTRPRAPDTWDPPYLRPEPHDAPKDWPEVTGMWSVWIEQLIRTRHTNATREPGED